MQCTRVLTLLVLLAGLVQSFKWDIVVGGDKQLEFYYNGTLTHTEVIPSALLITSITYDPVHYRVLFADNHPWSVSIFSFDLSTRKTQHLVTRTTNYTIKVVYEPVTQALYLKEFDSIYSFSLNPESSSQADGNLLLSLDNLYCKDLAVESCGGYIYWMTKLGIERARLDGSEREVLIDSIVFWRLSLAIDQQTQKMYWTEMKQISDEQWSIESANFNGKNRTTLYIIGNVHSAFSLAVSKDFIYWQNFDEQGIRQLPKYSSQTVARKLHSVSSSKCQFCRHIAVNYTMEGHIQDCDSLQGRNLNDSQSGATVCQNYCFKGECSVSAEGQPTCSCKVGYSGERCEVNACHDYCLHGGVCSLNEEGKRVCQCTAGYDGERCDVSICKDYCVQGNCSAGAEGQPKCSSDDGNSLSEGKVSACHQFCLNDGTCSLDKSSAPVCQCTADYVGERCEVPACIAKWVLHAYNDEPLVTLSDAVESG